MSNKYKTPEEIGEALARGETISGFGGEPIDNPFKAMRAWGGLLSGWMKETSRKQKEESDAFLKTMQADTNRKEKERLTLENKAKIEKLQGEVLQEYIEIARLQSELDLLQGKIDQRPSKEEIEQQAIERVAKEMQKKA